MLCEESSLQVNPIYNNFNCLDEETRNLIRLEQLKTVAKLKANVTGNREVDLSLTTPYGPPA